MSAKTETETQSGRSLERLVSCPNCKEPDDGNCACMRTKCHECGESVGNVTFTVCDECWDKADRLAGS